MLTLLQAPSLRFLRVFFVAFLLSLLSLGIPFQASQSRQTSMDTVLRLVRSERWPEAIEALEKITAAEPDNGRAWFYLAYSHHNAGDLRKALQIGPKVIEHPEFRATGHYNMACEYSLLGEIEEAAESLGKAQAAGFLDFDLMESDVELANLRAEVEWKVPSKHGYSRLRGRNSVVIPYIALLPENFDPEKEYSVAVSFAPGEGGQRSTDWCIDELWSAQSTRSDWIVVCAVAPEDGWINHPSHHALEDLFKRLRKDYHVASNRFHLVGFGRGARPAATYSRMSRRYTATLTVASATCFDGWDDSDFRSMKKVPVHQLVGDQAEDLLRFATTAKAGLDKHDVPALVTVREGDGVLVQSLQGGKLLDQVARSAALMDD